MADPTREQLRRCSPGRSLLMQSLLGSREIPRVLLHVAVMLLAGSNVLGVAKGAK